MEGEIDIMEELQCPECEQWSEETKWEETEVPCDDCGTHSALKCPNCDEVFDIVFETLKSRNQ